MSFCLGIETDSEALKGEMLKLRQLLEDAEHRYSRLEEEKRDEKHSFEQVRLASRLSVILKDLSQVMRYVNYIVP